MTRQTSPTKQTVELVWNRDSGSCARCGKGLSFDRRGVDWSVHHRAARGMGGSKQPWVNLPSNLVVACGTGTTGCHSWIETNRETAYETGWLVRRHGNVRPVHIPVFHATHGLVWLTDDGRAEPTAHDVKF